MTYTDRVHRPIPGTPSKYVELLEFVIVSSPILNVCSVHDWYVRRIQAWYRPEGKKLECLRKCEENGKFTVGFALAAMIIVYLVFSWSIAYVFWYVYNILCCV